MTTTLEERARDAAAFLREILSGRHLEGKEIFEAARTASVIEGKLCYGSFKTPESSAKKTGSEKFLCQFKFRCRICGVAYDGSATGWVESVAIKHVINAIYDNPDQVMAPTMLGVHHCKGIHEGSVGVSDFIGAVKTED